MWCAFQLFDVPQLWIFASVIKHYVFCICTGFFDSHLFEFIKRQSIDFHCKRTESMLLKQISINPVVITLLCHDLWIMTIIHYIAASTINVGYNAMLKIWAGELRIQERMVDTFRVYRIANIHEWHKATTYEGNQKKIEKAKKVKWQKMQTLLILSGLILLIILHKH